MRFGDFSLNLKTKASPSIHIGDRLRVYGLALGGTVWPILLRNEQNSYEAGFVSLRDVVVPSAIGIGLVVVAVASGNFGWGLFGAAFLAAAGIVATIRHIASSAMRRAQTGEA